jgi:hypothetical protein
VLEDGETVGRIYKNEATQRREPVVLVPQRRRG